MFCDCDCVHGQYNSASAIQHISFFANVKQYNSRVQLLFTKEGSTSNPSKTEKLVSCYYALENMHKIIHLQDTSI